MESAPPLKHGAPTPIPVPPFTKQPPLFTAERLPTVILATTVAPASQIFIATVQKSEADETAAVQQSETTVTAADHEGVEPLLNSSMPRRNVTKLVPAPAGIQKDRCIRRESLSTEIAMEEVIEGGPWLFQGQPIVLQRWEPGMVLRKHKHTQVPVWIRLCHLPIEFWTDDGLSTVASGVGRPLYQDTITRACTRLDFARVCVMLDISSTLPKHLIIMMPREDGTEVPCKVEVEYEWVPPKCKNCMSSGHSTSACPNARKIDKSPVSVYVQKWTVQPPVSRPDVTKGADRKPSVARRMELEWMRMELHLMRCFRPGSYKQPLAYCYVMNAGIWNVRGLNRRDHQVAVKELVSEFRCGCTVYTLSYYYLVCAHLSVLATVVYGVNDTIADIQLAMTEFRDCILDTGLIHLPDSGRVRITTCRTSDHSPLVIRGDTVSHTVSMFRFDNYLTMSSEFTTSVQNIWRHQIVGTNMYAVTRKLRALKPIFRTLRKKKGDLSMNVKLAAEFLGTVQQLLQTDRHNTLLIDLEKCCKMVFFRATKLEQVMLQQRAKIQWLKGGDQCSRIFFRKVAMRRASKKVFQIANEAGRTLTEQDKVVDEFVSFYQRLLGEDKAPGPDGYSSGFYKAAWPVIGDEVVKAILEFFTTGRLLKQVNTTVLALIPKRLRLVLDAMISPSQNAFVPGRSIGDNILLAQEMFTGYNRQGLPKRCALKVDLRKGARGCDRGSDVPFLFVLVMEVLQLMMQQLIDQNEGFSYHWRCKELGLFQLCFADDLLLFCKADVASVQVFRRGLDEFANLSSLHANPQKSQLILSRSAQEKRERLIAVLQFQEGHLPLRVIREVEKRGSLEKTRQRGGNGEVVCPKEEGGLGIRDILALNKALMCRHLWNVIQGNQSSIWVRWIAHNQLRHKSVWTMDVKGGSWGWRKLIRLRSALLPYIELKIGDGESFSLWHDPWHSLGPLIQQHFQRLLWRAC
ncbi:putative ribonuclease H protein [Sesamum angolense]|uniref:Ribonuclease H protein n=1 Tax=Sesamum angolense TaxID=2727404 RepID=A0AAE1XAL5_9LAMI|nr:putative ribonuclease H protein [Sesamum angolense]